MVPRSPIVELKDLHFSYRGGQNVLKGVDFVLERAEKVGLIGHNGSGKSTLLQILMGLIQPTSGEIHFFGQQVSHENEFRIVRRKVGLVFQNADDQLFSPTVLEDVAFGLLNQGVDPEKAREKSIEMLKTLNLEGFENRVTHRLSGGEKKLVALATVLVMSPEVLLLDEPTTGLDADTLERIIDILNGLDITCLIVSHEFDYLSRSTQKIYTMQDGIIRYACTAEHLHTHYHTHPAGELPHEHI
jgi:cobalt/nickel transport system ATP-binding protein